MKLMDFRRLIDISFLIIIAGGAVGFVRCSSPILKSQWNSKPGIDADWNSIWENSRSYQLEKEGVTIGLRNDTTDLFIMLRATDRETFATVMRTGLTVWLNGDGDKSKVLGVRYPMAHVPAPGGRAGGRPFPPDRRRGEFPDDRRITSGQLDSMEVLRSGKWRTLPTENDLGITASLDNSQGVSILFMKIPLKANNVTPLALGIRTSPGELAQHPIGLGLETGKLSTESMKRPSRDDMDFGGGGMPPEGPGGPGQGRGGPRGGPPPGGMERPSEGKSIRFWARVILASDDSIQ
jgi:hypothetical protein